MAVTYEVQDWGALGEAVNPIVARVAGEVAAGAAAGSPRGPTGALAAGWKVVGPVRGGALVYNEVPWGRFAEYGTRHVKAAAMLGRAVATARGRYGR